MSDFALFMKHLGMQVTAGGSAGFIEVLIMQPLDLVKTRLQLQPKVNPQYTGIVDCLSKMYVQEGLRSFWKGIVPPIVAETPKRAVKFTTFEQYKKLFMFGSDKPTPLTFWLSGLGAGISEAIFVNPFEVVKVTMQSNRDYIDKAPSTMSVVRAIIKKNGLVGLNRGLPACILRNGTYNMIYLGLYNTIKHQVQPMSDPIKEFFRKVLIGFTAGSLASVINIPFDVVKSRIQGPQPATGPSNYHYVLPTFAKIYREEGIGAFYKGLLPKVLRLGPGGAILLVVYEHVYEILKKKFPD